MSEESPAPESSPSRYVAEAAQLSLRARSDRLLPETAGWAFQTLEQLVQTLDAVVPEPSQQLEILALFVDTCRITCRMSALDGAIPRLEALLGPGTDADSEGRARALIALVGALIQWGRYDEALAWHRRFDRGWTVECSVPTQTRILSSQAQIHIRLGDLERAQELLARVLPLAEQSRQPALQGTVWGLMAAVSKARGSLPEAHRLYCQAARLHRLGADHVGEARDHLNRGWLLNRMGLLAESYEAFEDVRALAASLGHSRLLILSLLGQGQNLVRQGEAAVARARLLRIVGEAKRVQMPRERCLALAYLGEADTVLRRYRQAEIALRLSRRLAERLAPDGDLVPECLLREAFLALMAGDLARARTHSADAAARAGSSGLSWERARGLRLLGTALALDSEVEEAQERLREAEELFRAMDEQLEIRLVRVWLRWLEERSSAESAAPPSLPLSLPLHVSALEDGDESSASRLEPETREAERAAGPRPARVGKLGPGQMTVDVTIGRSASAPSAAEAPAGRARATPKLHPVWRDLGLVTRSESMVRILNEAQHVARREMNTLVMGETGTGKELLAQGIHLLSGQRGAFVPFNCAGCPEGLIESELFGAERGAYTGANRKREGLILKAAGGTLFLDEVGDLRLETQGALLRFLDSGEVRALGSDEVRTVSLRVVSATHRPLRRDVAERRFRQDLYYRLAQSSLHLPPLRERVEDLGLLIEHLWPRCAGELPEPEFLRSPAALNVLTSYSWPGNVRELQQLLHRIGVLVDVGERLGPSHIVEFLMESGAEDGEAHRSGLDGRSVRPAAQNAPSPARTRRRRARSLPRPEDVRVVIESCGGDRNRAAEALGISRATLYRLLKLVRDRQE